MKVVKLPEEENVVEEVAKFGGEGIVRCIQCGSCMSVCPVAIAGFNYPNKKLFKLIILGVRKEILFDPSPWACVACGRCIEVCTRDVNPFSVYFAFRRIQTRQFSIPPKAKDLLRDVYETGFSVPPDNNFRKELGLPEVNTEIVEEIKEIIENSEIIQLGILPKREVI